MLCISGVLGEEDDVEDADRLVVDQLCQFRRDVVAHVAVGERHDEVFDGAGHVYSPLVFMISLPWSIGAIPRSQFVAIWRGGSDRIPDLRSP
jgi:hypothetical protein